MIETVEECSRVSGCNIILQVQADNKAVNNSAIESVILLKR
jgi:hypothetical protein